ncbi:tyrosine-type recombinase/integrase [Pseudomonas mandelii]|uniref:Site-specific integrase n=1 Tax=Pseudomonas mandelii TaxID=75612 RepID=A0A502IFM8_9PSED|nr:site-specific integrase [Pseudomonas mandelii]TPG84803.1 site-specific integrase [Pseudomonas mandelii]
MNTIEQLHTLLPNTAQLAVGIHTDGKELYFKKAGGLPTIYYPNGQYCVEANSWLVEKFRNSNVSLREKGGTLGQNAFDLSEIIRYLHYNNIKPIEMTNTRYEAFILGLSAKRTPNGAEARSSNVIRSIGSTTLDFLNHVGELHNHTDFIAKKGIIKAIRVDKDLPKELKYKARGLRWYHPILPTPEPEHRRYPISDNSINKLYQAAELRPRGFARRSKVLISVFEHTGARRSEVAALLVSDVIKAFNSTDANPLVRLITLKRRVNHFRFVPVPRAVIAIWIDYIKTTRKLVMVKKHGHSKDHDVMLINHLTGAPLSPFSIPNEIHDLKTTANIDEPAHAHLFRHRFITNKLKMLIMQFNFDNQDAFRRALLDISGFKHKIQEWVGHISVESLERYIHLACREITQEDSTTANALLINAAMEFVKYTDNLLDDLDRGVIDQEEYIAAMRLLRSNAKQHPPSTSRE